MDMLSLSEYNGEIRGWVKSQEARGCSTQANELYNEVAWRNVTMKSTRDFVWHQNAWSVVFCFFLQSFTTTALSLIKDHQRRLVLFVS